MREPWGSGGAPAVGKLARPLMRRARRSPAAGPCRRADRLHAVAGAERRSRPTPRPCRSPSAAWRSTCRRPRSASRCSAGPARRRASTSRSCGPRCTPPDLSIKPLPTDTPERHRPAVRDHRGERQHAVAGRAAEVDLSALRRRGADRRAGRAQRAGLPRRLALSGRGPDPTSRPRPSASCSAARARSPRRPRMCLHERRIAGADVTVRFPRVWLDDWRKVADGIDRLIAGFRPTPAPGWVFLSARPELGPSAIEQRDRFNLHHQVGMRKPANLDGRARRQCRRQDSRGAHRRA